MHVFDLYLIGLSFVFIQSFLPCLNIYNLITFVFLLRINKENLNAYTHLNPYFIADREFILLFLISLLWDILERET